jgi:hypothetical protein
MITIHRDFRASVQGSTGKPSHLAVTRGTTLLDAAGRVADREMSLPSVEVAPLSVALVRPLEVALHLIEARQHR